MSESSSSPRAVFQRLLDGVTEKRADELPLLYAEDAVVVHPFAEPVSPLNGRAALREHFAQVPDLPIEIRARNVVVHETADPEVIVAEFEYAGRVTTTGRAFTVPNIFVMRVRDGLIVESRDYAHHAAFAAALA
ncbi:MULTISPECIES: nuclear transport factor 2 family protein [Thermomonosporaceae]|uniref:nuclear transport factor 2 family protein n=1 Tax=Thermomonosporaceae TaxID=2012 RepID=UPI00255AFCD7|nr:MULTISPECIES: nuclear transport factor 2 family protein [Thermomonosporaceae]MDL4776450.1 nuclear transport factor 2 family protein [Actinomadura xylanilytica]